MGRAALYKMIYLPKFLYGLQNAMVEVPDTFFRAVDTVTRNLLWDGRATRIALTALCRGQWDGGIALPDLKLY